MYGEACFGGGIGVGVGDVGVVDVGVEEGTEREGGGEGVFGREFGHPYLGA